MFLKNKIIEISISGFKIRVRTLENNVEKIQVKLNSNEQEILENNIEITGTLIGSALF